MCVSFLGCFCQDDFHSVWCLCFFISLWLIACMRRDNYDEQCSMGRDFGSTVELMHAIIHDIRLFFLRNQEKWNSSIGLNIALKCSQQGMELCNFIWDSNCFNVEYSVQHRMFVI